MPFASQSTQVMGLPNERATAQLAKRLARCAPTGSVWLQGDLGAGKTTLTRFWLHALGHQGPVKSPTYTLVEPYQFTDKKGNKRSVYHADLYRLQDPEELTLIGFDEYLLEPNALVLIEWPSRADTLLPEPDLKLTLTHVDNDQRQASLWLNQRCDESMFAALQGNLPPKDLDRHDR